MKKREGLQRPNCKNFRHIARCLNTWALFLSLGVLPMKARAQRRDVASFVSQDEVIVVPRQEESWYQNNMIDDNQGIMNSMRVDIRRWQEQNQYLDLWGLRKTGIYPETPPEVLTARVRRDMLRYADKRLSGEVNKAEKGSNLYRVGQAQRSLSPSTQVSIFEGYSIKMQVRVIQGKSTFLFNNPYMKTYLEVTLGGRREFVTEKWFNNIFRAAVNYRLDQYMYFTTFDYRITPQVTASLVSQQNMQAAPYSGESDKRIQLNYFIQF